MNESSCLVMVMHCYDNSGLASLWFLNGVSDPTLESSHSVDDYAEMYNIIVEKLSVPIVRTIAENLIAVFSSCGISIQLYGLPDD